MPNISVVILTFNSEKYIEKLLTSLISKYEKEVREKKLEIIVADNNSSDSTLKIAGRISGVEAFNNGDNFGFAKGINLGASRAKGELLLFINPDSLFLRGDIFLLGNLFDNEKVGVVGGEMINSNGKKELSCGKFYNIFNVLLLTLGLEGKLGVRFSPRGKKNVGFVSGGFMMVRKSLWEKLGGFDENFFMYVEDMEFCFRIKKLGKKVVFSNLATIQHVGQASSNRAFAVVNIYKGLIYFHKKHMGFISLILVKTLLIIKAAILVIIGKISNNEYLYLTYSQALKTLK